jgi:hypothetical protein
LTHLLLLLLLLVATEEFVADDDDTEPWLILEATSVFCNPQNEITTVIQNFRSIT